MPSFLSLLLLFLMCVVMTKALLRPRLLSTLHATVSMSPFVQSFSSIPSQRLLKLREFLQKEGIDAFIVPTDDPHMSEYTAAYYTRREFLSGFTGSAGTAIVTVDKACLFTDGRYWTQAEAELSGEWMLMKQGFEGVPSPTEFLTQTLREGGKIGIDPYVHSALVLGKLQSTLLAQNNITIISINENPIDNIWEEEGGREKIPSSAVRVHPAKYAGKLVSKKLQEVRDKLKKDHASALISCSLDELCWLYNIRGNDIPCNPVTIAYALVTLTSAHLFIDDSKLLESTVKQLQMDEVTVHPYEETLEFLTELGTGEGKIFMDPKTTNFALFNAVSHDKRVEKESPLVDMKACKNEAEIAGMRACHLRDGAAEADFLSWLEEEIKMREVSEVEVDEKIAAFRQDYSPQGTETEFIEPSFPTIAAVNENAAIMHYRAVPTTCKVLNKDSMVLIDSGGQYLDGTTDVTRTFHLGTPTAWQKETYTRVLKGHISVDSKVFPVGTPGCLLDSYAREHLWNIGKDFVHGVGHGVGAGLNVHEGPCSISRLLNDHALKPGMVLSNEPGYYEVGNFGIRIENLLEVVKRDDMGEFAGKAFLGFERLTHIPIQKKMVDVNLMTDIEIAWLNEYHQQVRDRVGPLLLSDRARAWMDDACLPLSR